MLQVVQNNRTGAITVDEVPAPGTSPGQILVKNEFSLVSAGTERAGMEFANRSLIGKARSRPDLVQQVVKQVKQNGLIDTYRKVRDRLDEPQPLGYSSAGLVIEVGDHVAEVQPGMRVACAGVGYASHAEYVSVPSNLVAILPKNVESKSACFATLGAIAIQGIRRAELTPGENVGVIGLGLIGQITVLVLKAYGFPVFGVDIDSGRVEAAQALGMDSGGVLNQDDLAEMTRLFSKGHGLDAAIITAASSDSSAVSTAGEIVRERGRVSVIGDVGMEIPRRIYYPKELDFRISRSYGPGRYDTSYEEYGLDYPLPWVRWTEQRNMQEFLRLIGDGLVTPESLITHSFPISSADSAYELLSGNNTVEKVGGVTIEYDERAATASRRIDLPGKTTKVVESDTISVGLVGAGNFMSGILTPILNKMSGVTISSVASERGLTAQNLGSRMGASTATSEYQSILADPSIDLVVAATRHNLCSEVAIKSLKSGKSVHVEKPIALNLEDLRSVSEAEANNPGLLNVGFNRRFAPLVLSMKQHFENVETPLSMTYRVNAGALPPDHWTLDPVIGGGRIKGEVCHFVDLLQFFAGSTPKKISASAMPSNGGSLLANDNIICSIEFLDGSIGSIAYNAVGAAKQPKERLEISGGGLSADLDDFRSLVLWSETTEKKVNRKQDKGHKGMLEILVNSLKGKAPPPIDFNQIAASTLATFAIVESIQTGAPIEIDCESLTLENSLKKID